MKEPPIDPETLAALLDGRLTGERRAAALAALASDDAAYEAYADAVAVTRELEVGREGDEQGDAGLVRSIRSAPSWWRGPGAQRFLIAAGIAALIALPWAISRNQAPDVAPLWMVDAMSGPAAGVPQDWNPAPWGARRSVRGTMTPEVRASRVGARLVALELYARAGDSSGVAAAAAEIAGLLDSLPAAGPAAGVYRSIVERADAPYDQLAPLLERGRGAAYLLLDEGRLEMGAWAEAARVAARREDHAFFRQRESVAMLEQLGANPGLTDQVRSAAADAGAAAAEPTDWGALEASLERLLSALGRS